MVENEKVYVSGCTKKEEWCIIEKHEKCEINEVGYCAWHVGLILHFCYDKIF